MEIRSFCPFPAAGFPWEAAPNVYSLTVLVKATFLLVRGAEAEISTTQVAPADDLAWEPTKTSSLRLPSDYAPLKPRCDLILLGHAHAPRGESVTQFDCRVEVGDFARAFRVFGDRRYEEGPSGLVVGEAREVTRVPLRYERAARSESNPVGVDPSAEPSPGALALPNFEAIEGSSEGLPLGPILPSWPSRKKLVSEEGFSWAMSLRGAPRGPAPAGLDFGFFQAAPPEQQLALVRPSLPIVLEHLHPTLSRIESRLPLTKPQAFRIDPKTGRVSEIALRCDTLMIDTDRGRAIMVFRGLTDVPSPDPAAIGNVVVASHPQGKRVRPVDVEKAVRGGGSLEELAGAPELHPLEMRHDTRPAAKANMNETTAVVAPIRPATPFERKSVPPPSGLPFAPAPSALPFSPAPAVPSALPFSPPQAVPSALPFVSAQAPATTPPAAQALGQVRLGAPAQPAQPARAPEVRDEGTQDGLTARAPEPAMPFSPKDAVRPDIVALPTISLPDATPAKPERVSSSERVVFARVLPVPIHRYAAIAAEIAAPEADVGLILRRHGHDEAQWATIEGEMKNALVDDAVRGSGELLRTFDDAYVARMADLGRKIDMRGHARLQIATSRKEVSRCLADLGLGGPDLMPIRRTFARALQKNASLATDLAKIVDAERVLSPPPRKGIFGRFL